MRTTSKLSRQELHPTANTTNLKTTSSVLKGGSIGTFLGLVGGVGGVLAASKRYQTIRNLTIPMKSFLVTSSGTFVGIIAADSSSRNFEAQRNAERQWYETREQNLRDRELQGMSFVDRAVAFARREKYKIVGVTWIASMIGSFAIVGRNPYLSGQQKIVQARVYAQGLTLAVLVASASFEISDQRKGRGMLDSKKGGAEKKAAENAGAPAEKKQETEGEGDLWKDMVAAEEERLKKKHQSLYEKPHSHAEAEQQQEQKEQKPEKKEEGEKKEK